jgi:hypothetical protein
MITHIVNIIYPFIVSNMIDLTGISCVINNSTSYITITIKENI